MQIAARQRILVVDDDPRLRKLLLRFLGSEGFDVDAVLDAGEMERQLKRARYDLLLLDVMLPGENGFTICKRLRDAGATMSVIMLSAKGDDVDRIVGLRAGADDYVAKPFNPEELLARIHAVLRRRASAAAEKAGEAVVRFGPFRLNLGNRALTKGGVDYAIEMAGSVKAFETAYRITRRGGTTVTAGLPHPTATWPMPATHLVAEERTIKGSYIGTCVPQRDLPRYIELYRRGKLPVNRLMTGRLALDDINRGFDLLREGKAVRQVVTFWS